MLEMAEFLLVLAEARRPERNSTPGETVVRFRRNAIGFRAERNGENKQKFCHVSIFNAQKAMRRCHVRHVIPHVRNSFPLQLHNIYAKPLIGNMLYVIDQGETVYDFPKCSQGCALTFFSNIRLSVVRKRKEKA